MMLHVARTDVPLLTAPSIVAPGLRGAWALRLALVPRHPLDEGTLLVRVCLPQEASHLVVADADAPEQILHPAGRVGDAESLPDPVADVIRITKAAGADFGLELIDLVRGKFARVALVVQGAEGVEALVAIDTKPFAQLAEADQQQLSDF